MEIDKSTDLERIEDDFEEGAHEKPDGEVHQLFPNLTPQHFNLRPPLLLVLIVKQSGDHLLAHYLDVSECETIIKSDPRLRNMLLDGSKNGSLCGFETASTKISWKSY
ncbi:hypothetical protein SCLCIDRAFT_1218485 [Scleroderma citrinum Foug A]|uniref:Uncharacterized protein n=1 Tax=Scleroderma citrinum Foug A TaxID=1036808 RepID=A0A0C3DRB1_9AGAM|nr:hypothetical protein SCLCIDRAFT_1218485 [Scleroderma citrinum Foug A]